MANITGDDNNNSLYGDDTADSIQGLGGNDTISGGQGDDRLFGGEGDDFIYDSNFSGDTASDSDVLDGGAGNDRLYHYQGGHFQDNDTIYGRDGDDVVWCYGVQTNDSIDGGAGTDEFGLIMQGITASVFAQLNPSNFTVALDGVSTAFVAACEKVFLWTGSGTDNLAGGALADRIVSEGGADTIKGGGGDDLIEVRLQQNGAAQSGMSLNGGNGDDRLEWYASFYSSAAYNLDFAAGVFELGGASLGAISGFETLRFEGGAGADSVTAGGGNDALNGGDGNDILKGGDGHDYINGDVGSNSMYGGAGNDDLSMDPGADFNLLDGGDGNDSLGAYYGGTHTLLGGAGNDLLSGHELCVYDGGSGDDFYNINVPAAFTGPLNITDSSGTDKLRFSGPSSFSLAPYGFIENLEIYGSSGTGNNLGNLIISLTGNATLDGGLGDDTVSGDSGNDTVFGGAGDDVLMGDDGSGIGFGSGQVTKAAGAGNTGIATAIDVSGEFSLASDPNIQSSTFSPHVSVFGTGDGHGDFYEVDIERAGVWVYLDIDRAGLAGAFDSLVRVYDEGGTLIYQNDDAGYYYGGGGSTSDDDSFLQFQTPSAGRFYVEVLSSGGGAVPSGAQYRLQISVGSSAGDDLLQGGAGTDRFDGGRGNDTASFASSTGRVIASVLSVTNDGFGNAEVMSGIENLIGSANKDRLTGDGEANRLAGG
ncbi:MAG TPA: calcium-binding protein, partial [Caulobacteraceae bacterium]